MRGMWDASPVRERTATDSAAGRRRGDLLRAARARQPAAVLALQREAGNAATAAAVAQPDLSCSYEQRLLATWGPATKWPLDRLTRQIVTAFTGCDIAYVTIDVVPKSTGGDPREDAIEKAETIKRGLIQWIGPTKFAEDRFQTGLSSGNSEGAEVEVWLGAENRTGYSSGEPKKPIGPPEPPTGAGKDDTGASSGHPGVQAGVGDVRHYYTTPAGPNDALHEFVAQVVGAYTVQRHKKDESGEERQAFAQVQYSLTTKQFTVSFGGQEAYVFALPANLQLSFWAQLTGGENINAGVLQGSLSAGTQLGWQPKDWLTIGAQLGAGPTVQSQGPTSIDRTGLIFFQIQK